jgi:DNA repair exonuclease SbcCD ATPase subunit
MAIFLDEMLTPSASFGADYTQLDADAKAMGLQESQFKRFRSLDAGYEIVYEMECAKNELNMHFMKEEFQALREAEGDETKPSFWEKTKETIKRWWEKFKAALVRIGKAIKNFFIGIYEFIFKHDVWKAKRERLKKAKGRLVRMQQYKADKAKKAIESFDANLAKIKELEKAADTAKSNEEAAIAKADSISKELESTKAELKATTSSLREAEEAKKISAAEAEKNLNTIEAQAKTIKELEAKIEAVRKYAESLAAAAAKSPNAGMAKIKKNAATAAYSLIMDGQAAAAATAAAIKKCSAFQIEMEEHVRENGMLGM